VTAASSPDGARLDLVRLRYYIRHSGFQCVTIPHQKLSKPTQKNSDILKNILNRFRLAWPMKGRSVRYAAPGPGSVAGLGQGCDVNEVSSHVHVHVGVNDQKKRHSEILAG